LIQVKILALYFHRINAASFIAFTVRHIGRYAEYQIMIIALHHSEISWTWQNYPMAMDASYTYHLSSSHRASV